MKYPVKYSALRILRFGALPCLAILVFHLPPQREGHKVDSVIERVPLSRGRHLYTSFFSTREENQLSAEAERNRVIEEHRNELSLQQHLLLERTSGIKTNTIHRFRDRDEDSVQNLERTVLTASKPGTRLDAVEALTQTNELDQATQVLSQVLVIDSDADVRVAALEALDEIDAVPFETLAQALSHDPDPVVRIRALDLIGEGKDKSERVVGLLSGVAKADSSKDVRQLAASLLETMIRGR